MRGFSRFIVALLVGCALFGCQSDSLRSVEQVSLKDRIAMSPREDAEAEHMALLYSGEILAPENLYQTIKTELRQLREEIPDSLNSLKTIRFYPAIVYGIITPMMTLDGRDMLRLGQFQEWDELNELFGIDASDTVAGFQNDSIFWVNMKSPARTNSFLMGKLYQELDGVAEVHIKGTIGSEASIFYGTQGSKDFFLISDAWGDCPSRCLNYHFYVFEKNDNEYSLKNDWLAGSTEKIPDWLTTTMRALLVNRTDGNVSDIPWEIRRGLTPIP